MEKVKDFISLMYYLLNISVSLWISYEYLSLYLSFLLYLKFQSHILLSYYDSSLLIDSGSKFGIIV